MTVTTADDLPPTPADATDAPPAGATDATGGDAVASAFRAAGRALDAAGVTWLRLRDRVDGLEDDLLVAADDLGTARGALATLGWRERRHLGRGRHNAFHAYLANGDAWPKLDIVTGLDFGRRHGWRTDLAAGCLARREMAADGPRPAPDDAFWTLALHELLDRPGAAPRRATDLRRLATAARMDGPFADAVRPLLPRGTGPDAVVDAALEPEPDELARVGRSMSHALERRPAIIARGLLIRVLRIIDRVDPPFVRRGRSLALLGPDGAGKSSLARRVGRGGPMPVHSVYLGLYGGARAGAKRHRIPGIGLARRLAAMWRGWFTGWWHVRRGRLVVFDRHPYDARLGQGSRGLAARVGRAILGHALPRPDVVVVLDAPAELLVARKAEHPVDRIEAQRQRYLALAGRVGATVIDVGAPLDDVARAVTAAAWADRPTDARRRAGPR